VTTTAPDQARPGRQIEAIVDEADGHQNRTGCEECAGTAAGERQQPDAEDDAQKHRQPAHDRHVALMDLAAARTVD
jgi:hypothetical protein